MNALVGITVQLGLDNMIYAAFGIEATENRIVPNSFPQVGISGL